MPQYQKVIRGRDSLKKLPELMEKTGMHQPMIVGSEHLTGILFREFPDCFRLRCFPDIMPIPILRIPKQGRKFSCETDATD